MAAVVRSQALDFAADLPEAARKAIAALLAEEPKGARKVYAALARKVWSLLVERRFDDEIRDWHELLHGVKAHIRSSDGAAAERLAALADLLRESISLAQTSPARDVATRPRARRILEILNGARGFVARRALQNELAIGSSHLSNVLTQLVAHDLVDRRDKGKEAEFRITALGRQLIGADGIREDQAGERDDEPLSILAARVQDLAKDKLSTLSQRVIIMESGDTPRVLTMMAMPGRKMRAMGVLHADDTYLDSAAHAAHSSAHLVPDHVAWPIFSHRKPVAVHKVG
jgi:predicted transcriptional regulator